MAEAEGKKLNWQQACQILGCSRSYFYALVADGRLAGYRVGQRGLWVYESDCRKLLRRARRKRGGEKGC